MSNYTRSVLYIGVTGNLEVRVWQHRNNEGSVFTSKYKCHYLVYFEDYRSIRHAIAREKQLKNWHREWKLNLIKEDNPLMLDLAANWF
jgi:putative endonuclease